MLSATLETININLLSVEERYAFDILRNLPIDKLSRLKTLLKVDESQAIGRETLQKFLQFVQENRFDLTESGVNDFKEKHGLGNAPPWTGIIGSQTAEVYFDEIISLFPKNELNQIAHPNGAWIWNLSKLRSDYLEQLTKCKVKRVYLKVFDGKSQPMFWKHQCSPETVEQFKSRGIQVYGWGYHYGTSDVTAQVSAVKQALDCGLDGYILDLEAEVENKSTHPHVERLLSQLRPLVKPGTLGYTSFGHPGFHPNVPWKILDQYCDIALPQIYFEKFEFEPTNEEEVQACLDAHKQMELIKPILPIWGSEWDTKQPASAKELQFYLNRFPGSSIFLLPHVGEGGEAWNLDYSGQPVMLPGSSEPKDFELPELTRILRQGTKGEDVKALQRILNAQGFNAGEVDGDFGDRTEAAVRAFQIKASLTIDGEVGPQTWKALDPEAKAIIPPDLGIRAKLADFAEDEAAKGLRWTGSDSEAEKYLKPLRKPMQDIRPIPHIGLTPVNYDWCAAFVTYCCRQVGMEIPDKPEGFWATMALVDSWKFWAQKQGYWYTKGSITPRRGDILVFEWGDGDSSLDHIGIVRGYTLGSSTILTSEGNNGNRSGNFTRELSFVAGFIRIS
ncbi:peptidoglycan-binding protein [Tolypothrix sp. VBCCA 56010]|uniref:peptidoglycan-binding protein n=1 Tax=Tolypothrix sp. VBCCA 56010 TaxID=3137731 RepID=UPI003D7D0116